MRDEPSDADLVQALEQNTFIKDIVLNLNGEQRAAWDSLLRVMATRVNLEKVKLLDSSIDVQRNTPTALVGAFLHAIQQNPAIRSVEMCWLPLPTNIPTFLDNASSIISFSLNDCEMDPAEREQGTSALVAAFQRNANIESLELWKLDNIYAIPILEGLQLNTAVKTLIFSAAAHFSDASSHAVQRLLGSTTSIQRFELQNEITFVGRNFRPIAQAITDSECVSELKFFGVGFQDQSSITQLKKILQNKRNLTALCLHYCSFGGGQVYQDIISMLSRPDSLLRCFEFQVRDSLERHFPRIQFEALLLAIQKSKLERFKIGDIQTQQQLQALTGSIPLMCVKELEVSFWRQVLRENTNPEQNLLLAIKNNFSLLSVKGEMQHDDLFETAEDKQRLAFYANRNESLDQWVNLPEMIKKQKVWPEALALAERAGPDALFRGLRSVLGSDYVSLPGGRKRKQAPS